MNMYDSTTGEGGALSGSEEGLDGGVGFTPLGKCIWMDEESQGAPQSRRYFQLMD